MEHLRENEPIERNINNIDIQNNRINNNINLQREINNNIYNENNINNIEENIYNNNHLNNNIQNNNNNNNENHINNNGNENNRRNNLHHLNYIRFGHILHTQELEFLLNRKYSKSISEIIYTLFFTKNCHKISFSIILFLLFCILYFIYLMNYKNSSIIIKLESEDSYFGIIIWMIIICVIIISWNFYLFLYISIFLYDYSKKENNIIRTSFVEDFYKNCFGFIFLLYYFDNQILKNVIDTSFWVLIGFEYTFIHYHLNQFYIQFYKELNSLTELKNTCNILKKVNLISIFFLIASSLLIIFNYMITEVMEFFHKFIFLSKGIYLILKIIELWKIYIDEYRFSESNMDSREKLFLKNFQTKSFLELGSMIYVHFQIIVLVIKGDSVPFYFNVIIFYFIIILGLQIFSYYKKYKEIRDYFLILEQYLKKAENLYENDDQCIICTEKMTTARKLECSHSFHLICLSKWFENGHYSCPICRKEINFSEKVKRIIRSRNGIGNNEENQNRNRIFSFRLNSNLFSWIPNFSLRIIRFYNNEHNNGNNGNIIINNNPNINHINLNLQRPNINQRVN